MTTKRSALYLISHASENLGLASLCSESALSCIKLVIINTYYNLLDARHDLDFDPDFSNILSDLISKYKYLLDARHIDY